MSQRSKKKKYSYDYPRPMVTVDIAGVRWNGQSLQILLIKRKNSPFRGIWAFPGGYIEMKEKLAESAAREFEEETGLNVDPEELICFYTAGDPDRDPRGRTISPVFLALIPFDTPIQQAGDDASDAKWFSLHTPPPLAFDHDLLWVELIRFLRVLFLRPVEVRPLLPFVFSLRDLYVLYRELYSVAISYRSFEKAMNELKVLEQHQIYKRSKEVRYQVVFSKRAILHKRYKILNLPPLWKSTFPRDD